MWAALSFLLFLLGVLANLGVLHAEGSSVETGGPRLDPRFASQTKREDDHDNKHAEPPLIFKMDDEIHVQQEPAPATKIESDEERAARKARNINSAISRVRKCFHNSSTPRAGNSKRAEAVTFRPHLGVDPLVQFDHAFDALDVQHLLAITNCVRLLQPDHFEDRPFDRGTSGYGGGNNVTYIGGFVEAIMPELAHHILDVAAVSTQAAEWYPHPRHLGFRCIEILEYYQGGELLMHQDSDSVYTMVFMLGEPRLFTGGQFVIRPRAWDSRLQSRRAHQEISLMPPLRAEPELYGGIIFDSLADHAVTPIDSGKRTVLAVELWPFDHVDITGLRPHARFYKDRGPQRPHIFSNRLSDTAHRSSATAPNARPPPTAHQTNWADPASVLGAAGRALGGISESIGESRQFYAGLCFGLAAGIVMAFFAGESGSSANEIPPTMRSRVAGPVAAPSRGAPSAGGLVAAAAAAAAAAASASASASATSAGGGATTPASPGKKGKGKKE